MAMSGAIPVSFEKVFPHGAWMEGEVRAVKDFQRSVRKTATNPGQDVQQALRGADGEPLRDDEGLPVLVWEVDVYDPDPDAFEKRLKVKIHAARQPVPPEALEDSPFRRIEFEGLAVQPWVNQDRCKGPERDGERHRCRARQAYSLRATGIVAVGAASASKSTRAA
jgi:hypothetical protein